MNFKELIIGAFIGAIIIPFFTRIQSEVIRGKFKARKKQLDDLELDEVSRHALSVQLREHDEMGEFWRDLTILMCCLVAGLWFLFV